MRQSFIRSLSLVVFTLIATSVDAGNVAEGPRIVYFGISSPSDLPIAANPVMENGRQVYSWPQGYGISVVIEAAPGDNRRAVGINAFAYDPTDPLLLPDLQVLASYPLGNGNPTVCEDGDEVGIPGIESLTFDGSGAVSDAINDFGCRVDNGEGEQLARVRTADACTKNFDFDFEFVNPGAQVQFCATIARSFEFAFGDTVLAARVRDQSGEYGPPEEIVIRVTGFGPTATPAPTNTPTPSRSPSATRSPSPTITPVPTATPTVDPPCPADCSGNHVVIVGEILTAVRIALERDEIELCPNADVNRDGHVFVDELTRAVRALLDGC